MKKISPLRNLFLTVNLKEVYALLHARHMECGYPPAYKLEDCTAAYSAVILQMMMRPIKKSVMPLYVEWVSETWAEEITTYFAVKLLNEKYESPPTGLKPWYGSKKKIPTGFYNPELNKYNKFFAVFCPKWEVIINANVILDQSAIDVGISNEQLVAEILWEITFYGFTEQAQDKVLNTLKTRVKEVKKEYLKK